MTDWDSFTKSLALASPAVDWPPALAAVWWLAKGNWDRAHGIVQEREGDAACNWVHAHLHRVEGDTWNAAYWYRRAARPAATAALDAERAEILAALLRAAAG